MTEEKADYNLDQLRREFAALRKYAAMQSASEDKIGVQRIYIDITGEWYTALILDEIIFWTLPRKQKISGLRIWKDGVLWLAVSRSEWWERKRLSERQADRAIDKLIEQNLVIKKLFKFNNSPTVHLRLNIPVFFEKYSSALIQIHPPENESDSIVKDIADLYEMMGFSNLPNGENGIPISPNGNTNLPNGNTNLPNGEILNSPDSALTQPKRKAQTIEEAIWSGQPVTEDLLEGEKKKEQAFIEFESTFGFGTLPWNSNSTWDKFAKFIIKCAKDDPGWPADYVQWRAGDGKYKAFSNRKIRENPQAFIDTGYPEYDACKMYRDNGSQDDYHTRQVNRMERL